MPPTIPRYFDFLIEGFRAGQAGRDVHLGYWDDPPPLAAPCSAAEFARAQARLTDILIDLSDVRPGHAVLDVGCGFGGTLEALAGRSRMQLVGLNIDRRQLDICRGVPLNGSTLSLVAADAGALPFATASFDRVFCVEAMFHFGARAAFLRDAACVLRGGGRLVVSDILLRKPGADARLHAAAIETILGGEYGPWPEPWGTADDIRAAAAHSGLTLDRVVDATRQTLPTYRITAPLEPGRDAIEPRPSAGHVLRWLHGEGYLSYLCMVFGKR